MSSERSWDPLTQWRPAKVDWVRVTISNDDLRRFTRRSDAKGLAYAVGFMLVTAAPGVAAYLAFVRGWWVAMAVALFVHGQFYSFYGNALHELSHNTVFASRWLTVLFTSFFGWLYWPFNPHLYRLSHQKYHHRYTLQQGSDGEDAPNYVELSPRLYYELFLHVVHLKALVQNLYRVFSLTPTSMGWRGRGFRPDAWERFIMANASDAERRQVQRHAVASLVGHVVFVGGCVYLGQWFVPILVTLAPFYGARFMGYMAGIHQHAACEANHPDFRVSCGDAKLDPLTSFLYWRMEYHIEHHSFAAIPCYNLPAFSRFVADQLPPKEPALPRIKKLHQLSKQKFGSPQQWREQYGIYKGL